MSGPTPDPVERRGGLRDLRIQRLGVIEDAFVELADGLNVLTGETGAGKTMVVSGLGLLLGARGDSSLVRTGARAVVVEGCVDVPQGHPALARVERVAAADHPRGTAEPGFPELPDPPRAGREHGKSYPKQPQQRQRPGQQCQRRGKSTPATGVGGDE